MRLSRTTAVGVTVILFLLAFLPVYGSLRNFEGFIHEDGQLPYPATHYLSSSPNGSIELLLFANNIRLKHGPDKRVAIGGTLASDHVVDGYPLILVEDIRPDGWSLYGSGASIKTAAKWRGVGSALSPSWKDEPLPEKPFAASTPTQESILYTWTGAIDSDWNNPDNWWPLGVPTDIDLVEIHFGTIEIGSTPVSIAGLSMSGGNISHVVDLVVTQQLTWTGGTFSGSGVLKSEETAIALILGSDDKTLAGNEFINRGSTYWESGNLSGDGRITNTGLFASVSQSTLYTEFINTKQGQFAHSGPGILTVENRFMNSGFFAVSDGTVVLNGGLSQNAGEVLVDSGIIDGTGNMLLQGGKLSGTGSIAPDVFNTGGTVSPGWPHGHLVLMGNYNQGPNGVLFLELGGNTPGVNTDVLEIAGDAMLDGNLMLVRTDGYNADPSDSLPILYYGTRTGEFPALSGLVSNSIGQPFILDYGPTQLVLSVDGGPTSNTQAKFIANVQGYGEGSFYEYDEQQQLSVFVKGATANPDQSLMQHAESTHNIPGQVQLFSYSNDTGAAQPVGTLSSGIIQGTIRLDDLSNPESTDSIFASLNFLVSGSLEFGCLDDSTTHIRVETDIVCNGIKQSGLYQLEWPEFVVSQQSGILGNMNAVDDTSMLLPGELPYRKLIDDILTTEPFEIPLNIDVELELNFRVVAVAWTNGECSIAQADLILGLPQRRNILNYTSPDIEVNSPGLWIRDNGWDMKLNAHKKGGLIYLTWPAQSGDRLSLEQLIQFGNESMWVPVEMNIQILGDQSMTVLPPFLDPLLKSQIYRMTEK